MSTLPSNSTIEGQIHAIHAIHYKESPQYIPKSSIFRLLMSQQKFCTVPGNVVASIFQTSQTMNVLHFPCYSSIAF